MRCYDPLSVDELGKNAVRALMEYEPSVLPPDPSFDGDGVYTVYYRGNFPAYASMGAEEPIYVGKADGSSLKRPKHAALHGRLTEHAQSVEQAENLDLGDFECRWLVLNSVWIGLTEQILIARFRPIWNHVVLGFGNHHQGHTRTNQRRSRWDTMHPGRGWARNFQPGKDSVDDITKLVEDHRA